MMLVAMVTLFASVAQADLVVTTATGTTGADSYVRNSNISNYGTGDVMMIYDGGGYGYDRIAYMRFDLSSLDFTVTEATIALTQTADSTTYWRTFISVYALDEHSDYGTGKLGEDWGETSIHGNNAPGANNTIDKLLDPSYTTLLGTIADPATVPALTSLTFSTNLECFNNDTNDMVTLIVVQSYPGYYSYIASKEHATLAAPTLTLTPEPATMTLLLLGLPFALRRRR